MILYLHGFRSSPSSAKARRIATYLQAANRASEYICPQLPASPKLAMNLLTSLCAKIDPNQLTIIGSSLGGFYATYLAEKLGCRAVLLNPGIKPPRDLASQVGISKMYHSLEEFEFRQEYIRELELYTIEKITRPERYFLVAATGDEVLDWNEMVAHYPGAKQLIIQGSDHGISDFDRYIDQVMAFCDVP